MTDRCNCDRAWSAHHHRFGGTVPCTSETRCVQCEPLVERAVDRTATETRPGQ